MKHLECHYVLYRLGEKFTADFTHQEKRPYGLVLWWNEDREEWIVNLKEASYFPLEEAMNTHKDFESHGLSVRVARARCAPLEAIHTLESVNINEGEK